MLSLRAAGAAIDNYVIAQGAGFLGITRTLVISGTHFLFCQDPYLTYVSGGGGGGGRGYSKIALMKPFFF